MAQNFNDMTQYRSAAEPHGSFRFAIAGGMPVTPDRSFQKRAVMKAVPSKPDQLEVLIHGLPKN